MDLKSLVEYFRRRWWILVLMGVVAGGASYYISNQMTPIYQATTTVLVNQTQTAGVIQYNDVLTSERLTSTYAELVQRRPIINEVKRRLNLPHTEQELLDNLSVTPLRNTQLLRISVKDADPSLAAQIANTTAQAFIDDNAQQPGSRPGTVSIAELANIPRVPVEPRVLLNTVLALLLGVMVGAAIGVVLEYMDDTVKSADDVEALTGLTTLGSVTRFKLNPRDGRRPRVDVMLDPGSAEDYRQIRTNIHFGMFGLRSRSILVTSSNPGEGKTTTAANLAGVLAQAGHSVILIDADLRRPSLHRYFNSQNSFGLTGLLLSDSEDIELALLNTPIKGLRLLPSGPLPPNPSEILMSGEVHRLIEQAKAKADYLIIDSPPILAVTDARILAGLCDATVMVIEPKRTRSEAFSRAKESLTRANARIVGVVLNKVQARHRGDSGYYGYYRREVPVEDDQPVELKPRERRSA